jgi:hypothetical protein
MNRISKDEMKSAVNYAAQLLHNAIHAETKEPHRGHTIAAMGVAEGTLRVVLASFGPDTSYGPDNDTDEEPRTLDLSKTRGDTLDWKAVADCVVARRNWLGMSQFDVLKAGGPSEQTMRRIEGCQRFTYEPRTLARLERALGWKPNTITAILNRAIEDRQSLIGKKPQ